MNKETFAAELVCLLDVASLASDVAVLKAEIESFFIAGSARIDLIAKVMNLDNDIGGYNFDIPVLQDTEKAITDISTSPGSTVVFFRLSKLISRERSPQSYHQVFLGHFRSYFRTRFICPIKS